MKNRGIIISVVVVVAVIAVYFIFFNKKKPDAAAQGTAKGKPASVVAGYVVSSRNISNSIEASGTILSNEEVEIRPEIQARIIKLYFTEGTKVGKGQLLVKLYDADLLAQLKKQEAQLKLTEKNLERLGELVKVNGVSKQEYDATQTQMAAIQADIELLRTQVARTEIRAPFEGIIGLKNVSEGAFVTPTNIIATLQQTNPLKVDFAIPEKYAVQVRQGAALRFTVDGFRDTFEATVYAIEPKIELTTRNVKIRARCNNSSGRLRPGMFAKVRLGLENLNDAVMIPSQAVIPEARGKKVILSKNGMAVFASVETGIRDEEMVQIISGVQPGDTVITSGIMQIRPNTPVKLGQVTK